MPRAVVSEGKYLAKIVSSGLGESKEKKTPFVFFTFTLLNEIGGDGKPIKCPAFERTLYRYITPETIDFVLRDLQNLGYDREGFEYLDPNHPQAFVFAGKQITVTCKHEEYKGEDKERWDLYWGGGPAGAKLGQDNISRLNALFADKLKAAKEAAGAKSQPKANYGASCPNGPAEEVF